MVGKKLNENVIWLTFLKVTVSCVALEDKVAESDVAIEWWVDNQQIKTLCHCGETNKY